jgi:hypothetical protein
MARRKRQRPVPHAAAPAAHADPAAAEAETERLRHELADRILRIRCRHPNLCNHGACRRAKVCLRLN